MKKYCLVESKSNEDGTFTKFISFGPGALPESYDNISNLNASEGDDEFLKTLGWLPVETQTEDKAVQVSVSYEIFEDKVIENIITRDKTEEELQAEKNQVVAYQWSVVRNERNRLLNESDKLVVADKWEELSLEEKGKLSAYRKALRDLPNNITSPFEVQFPVL